MTPGPMPNSARRRRNTPAIPTTALPATGRTGTVPRPPRGYDLGDAGRAWWRWAWHLPQAAGWSSGDTYAIARRASLEDDLATLALVDTLDLGELLEIPGDDRRLQVLAQILGRTKALATGRLQILREMRELDDRLALTPKGLAALRWKITAESDETTADDTDTPGPVTRLSDRRRRLTKSG